MLGTALVLGLAAALLVGAAPPATAQGETFVVTTTDDDLDADACSDNPTAGDECSLRAAVLAANDAPGSTIVLDEGVYALTIEGAGEDDGESGDLDVHADMTIQGAGAADTVIDASPLGSDDWAPDRAIHVHGASLALDGLTVTGGGFGAGDDHADEEFECPGDVGCSGAGILLDVMDGSSASLTGDDLVVRDNPAALADEGDFFPMIGGGIGAIGATDAFRLDEEEEEPLVGDVAITLTDSQVSGNIAGLGGGIGTLVASASVTLESTLVGGEEAIDLVTFAAAFDDVGLELLPDDANIAEVGGGLGLFVDDLVLTVADSAIDGNAAYEGGGLAAWNLELFHAADDGDTPISPDMQGSVALTDTSVSGNAAEVAGGVLSYANDAIYERAAIDGNEAVVAAGVHEFVGRSHYLDSSIDGNVAGDLEDVEGLVGALFELTPVTFERSSISDNDSDSGFGAVFVTGDLHWILQVDDGEDIDGQFPLVGAELIDSTVADNVASEFAPGVTVTDFSEVDIGFGAFETAEVGDPAAAAFARLAAVRAERGERFADFPALPSVDLISAGAGARENDNDEPPPELGAVTIAGTTLSDNVATGDDEGWGAFGALFAAGVHLDVVNSTVSGNHTPDGGSGVVTFVLRDEEIRLTNSTFVDNTTAVRERSGEPAPGFGDGLLVVVDEEATGIVEVANTVLAGAVGDNCHVMDISALEEHLETTLVSLGGNVEDDDTCGFGSDDLVETDPQLGPLAGNGGPTATHLPDAGSPVLGFADGDLAPETDQRGVTRPQGGAPDSGAVERAETADLALAKEADTETVAVGDELTYTLTAEVVGPPAVEATAPDVVVTDELPELVAFVDGSPACEEDDGTVTCDLGDLDFGDSATVEVTVEAVAAGTATNEAVALSAVPDPDETNNVASATVEILGPPVPDGVHRLAGADRIATAIDVSNDQFGDAEAGAVVLARSTAFPDALAGTPLAIYEDAPLLLTPASGLDSRVQAEIQRVLDPGGTVYLLGGDGALQPGVQAALDGLGYDTVRLSGPSRFETAVAIAEQIDELVDVETLLVATGADFADALAGGAASAQVNGAILLTAGSTMHPATQGFIDDHAALARYALGGPASAADPAATAISGATRFETAVEVAEEFFETPTVVGVATGLAFPDALTGGAHVGRLGGPILLNLTASLHPAPQGYLEGNAATLATAYLYGGPAVLTAAVESAVADAISE